MFIYAYVMLGTTVGIVPPDLWRIKVTLVLKNTIFVEISTGHLSKYIKYRWGYVHRRPCRCSKSKENDRNFIFSPKITQAYRGTPLTRIWGQSESNKTDIRRSDKKRRLKIWRKYLSFRPKHKKWYHILVW